MKTNHSFEHLLKKWLRKTKPLNVLEWGPGKSTSIIHQECPLAKILSIESNEHYKKQMSLEHSYADIVLAPIPAYGPSEYSCWPLLYLDQKYDFIFIDGRQRVSCLISSMFLLAESGVIIIHDSERKHYKHAISLFKTVDSDEYTSVLRPK